MLLNVVSSPAETLILFKSKEIKAFLTGRILKGWMSLKPNTFISAEYKTVSGLKFKFKITLYPN